MKEVASQVNDFLKKCQELKKCKFIMAPTKITDVLKSIVNSRTLYDLFSSVSDGFDYLSAKSSCLVDISDGFSKRGMVILPSSPQDKLAFIFCLLVEIDRDSINFNWFLQKYFSDDGSFYSSYLAFCKQLIDPMEKIIRGAFEDELSELSPDADEDCAAEDTKVAPQNAKLSGMLSAIGLLISREKQFLLQSALPDDDRETGCKMLDEIYGALKSKNFSTVNSLVNGYNYYILYNNTISPDVQSLFEGIESFEAEA